MKNLPIEKFAQLHRHLWEIIENDPEEDIYPKYLKNRIVKEIYKYDEDPDKEEIYESLEDNSDCFACIYADLHVEDGMHFCTACPITKWRENFDNFGIYPCSHLEYGEFTDSEYLCDRREAAEKIKNLEWSEP